MYLISEKVKGRREVPGELPPSMIPPSKRKGAVKTPTSSGKVGGVPSDSAPVQSFGKIMYVYHVHVHVLCTCTLSTHNNS